MSGKLLLTAKMEQRLLMNQQLKQVINLLQYTTLELKQQIQECINTNPMLEVPEENPDDETFPDWETQHYTSYHKMSNHDNDSDNYLENMPQVTTFRDHLIAQSLDCHFSVKQQLMAEAIIDAIDEHGYLTMTLDDIAMILNQEINCDMQELTAILNVIQTFQPVGVGARTSKECLLIQIDKKQDNLAAWRNVRVVLLSLDLSANQLDIKQLVKQTQLKEKEVIEALQLMKTLELHPAKQFSGFREQAIEPELYIKKINHQWRVFLSDTLFTKLNINKEYQAILKRHTRDKSYKSLSGQLQEARLLLNGLKRRNETLLAVAEYIVAKQSMFFEKGSEGMKAMTLADAAADLGYHESTISRITTGKYIATPQGMFELKYFFPSHVKTASGHAQSSTAVKSMIAAIIKNEEVGRAYSDDQIMLLLRREGIRISRRTVTKYREALHIPSSYQRTDINMLRVKQQIKEPEMCV